MIAVLSTMLVLPATPAPAFTTGPHEEISAGAMRAEGFGSTAIKWMQVNNTYTDLYQWVGNASIPYSGHSGILSRLAVQNLSTEKWPIDLVTAATRSHFDNSPAAPAAGQMTTLGTTEGVTNEYKRLQRSVWTMTREARDENNPEKLLAVLGTSTHQIQDFYAHTNWVEPQTGLGADGPGWQEKGFGSYPTWYDVPASAREKTVIYGDSTPGHSRSHGFWSSDENRSLRTMMNKDSIPRPYYLPAAITAYYATRQWTQAVRSWVNDDAFWQRAQTFEANERELRELDRDHDGLFNMMLYSGRWEGQGEPLGGPGETGPSGDLVDLRSATKHYFEQLPKSKTRGGFERMIRRLADRYAPGEVEPVPSSQEMQRTTRILVVKITSMRGEGLGDPGPDDADMYARMRIDGQPFHSDVFHGHDKFGFGIPNAPITKFKVVPAVVDEAEPVESVEVEVQTADARWAGTDDDVFLRLGEGLRFKLDKGLTNDFESGNRDTYSVPIDAATRDGMRVGDITMLQIEKSKDGRFGGAWKLGGVKLRVNGREFFDKQGINGWLENGRLSWRPVFVGRSPHGPRIPIWIEMREDDHFLGEDDQGDIHPDDGRDAISFGYVPGATLRATTKGGERLGGRLGTDGDDAWIAYSVETLTPELIGTSGPVALRLPPPAPADLVITALDFGSVTVKNQGAGPAGAFRVRVEGANGEDTPTFSGLAAGASETRELRGTACEFVQATVDDLGQVEESDETNNQAVSGEVIC